MKSSKAPRPLERRAASLRKGSRLSGLTHLTQPHATSRNLTQPHATSRNLTQPLFQLVPTWPGCHDCNLWTSGHSRRRFCGPVVSQNDRRNLQNAREPMWSNGVPCSPFQYKVQGTGRICVQDTCTPRQNPTERYGRQLFAEKISALGHALPENCITTWTGVGFGHVGPSTRQKGKKTTQAHGMMLQHAAACCNMLKLGKRVA